MKLFRSNFHLRYKNTISLLYLQYGIVFYFYTAYIRTNAMPSVFNIFIKNIFSISIIVLCYIFYNFASECMVHII